MGIQDSDNDGVADFLDNCPTVRNTQQADQDQDAVGNPCDNCPVHFNPTQADRDGDSVGDICDAEINEQKIYLPVILK